MAVISPGISTSNTGPDVQWVPGKYCIYTLISKYLSKITFPLITNRINYMLCSLQDLTIDLSHGLMN